MDAVAELLEWRREHGVYTAPAGRDYSPPPATHGAVANALALTGTANRVEPFEEDPEVRAARHREHELAMATWRRNAWRYRAGPVVYGGWPLVTSGITYVGPLATWIGAVVTWNYQQNIECASGATVTVPTETVSWLLASDPNDWQAPGFSTRSAADTSLSADAVSTVRHATRSVSDTSASSDAAIAYAGERSVSDTSLSSDAASTATHSKRSTADTSASSDSASTVLASATTIAQVSLAAGSTPFQRTNHFLWIRGRTQTTATVTFRMLLFQGSTQITSAILETTPLTTSIASYSLSILSGDAANISDYTALSAQFWAYSSTVAHPVVEVEEVWLQIPHV